MASRGSLCAIILLLAAAVASALPVDDHTLFYCSFDRGAVADYSAGSPQPDGVVGLAEGKFGKALSTPLGLLPFADSVAPITTGIQYDAEGNFNLQRGTIELWVRAYGPLVETTEQSPKLRYLVSSGRFIGENHGFALVLSHFDGKVGQPYLLLWTRNNGAAKEKSWSVSYTPNWQPGEWHHVAVTYSPTEDALFIDGKCVGRTKTTEGMDLIGERFAVGANHYHGHVSDCAIDDLRLSDNIRYTADFTPAVSASKP